MKKIFKKVGYIGGAIFLFAILILTIGSLFFYYNKSLTKSILQNYLSKKTGVKIEIGKLDYGLFPLSIRGASIRISQKTQGRQLEVFLKELNARGELKNLLKNRKPIFDSIEIENADVRIRQEAAGKTDLRETITRLREALGYVKKLILKDISLDLATSAQNITFHKANLSLSPSHQAGAYVFSLDCQPLVIKINDKRMSFESELVSSGTLKLADGIQVIGTLSLDNFRFALPRLEDVTKTISIKLNSQFKADKTSISLPQWTINIANLAEASGTAEIDLKEGFKLRLNSQIELKDLEYLLNDLRPYIPQKLKSMDLKGKARVEGNYDYSRNSQGRKDNLNVSTKFKQARIKYSSPEVSFQALTSGNLILEGPAANVQISGEIRSQQGQITAKNIEIRDLSLTLPLTASKNSAHFTNFQSNARSIAFILGTAPLSFDHVEIKGSGSFKVQDRVLQFSFFETHLPNLPPLQSSARIDFTSNGEKYVKLKTSGVRLEALRNLFSTFMPKNLGGWEFDSKCDIEAEVRNSVKEKAQWQFSAKLALTEAKCHDSSFTLAGDGLRLAVDLQGRYDVSPKSLWLSGSFGLDRGESLWKDFYIDWSKNPVTADFSGSYTIPGKQLDEVSLNLSLPTLGKIHVQGRANIQAPFILKLKADVQLGLASLHSLILKNATGSKDQVDLKGEVAASVNIEEEKDMSSLAGNLELKEGTIENQAAGFSIQGIQARVPFCLVKGQSEDKSQEALILEKGYIRAKEFKTSFFTIHPLELSIQSGKNLFVVEPFSVALFGGVADIGNISFSVEPQTLGFAGLFSLRLRDLDLSQSPLKSTRFDLKGTARANLSRIEINPQRLVAQGQGEIQIFGGLLTIQNISIANPFSKGRTLAFDVDIKNMDLEKLTDSIPFGKVTGILNGRIKNLAISYGQPESFDLRLESVKKKGVAQKFSLKSVDSLAVLSSGEKTGISSSAWWTHLVSSFRYDKIGIWSTLKNDMFTLRGTIVEKGVEYLVRRSWLFGIDVVNREPEKKVSFKEMLGRLKRIGKSKESE
jgi:hypothetical protein